MKIPYAGSSKFAAGALSVLLISVLLLPLAPIPPRAGGSSFPPCRTWSYFDPPDRLAVLVWVLAFGVLLARGLRDRPGPRWLAIAGAMLCPASTLPSEWWRSASNCYNPAVVACWSLFLLATIAMFLLHSIQPGSAKLSRPNLAFHGGFSARGWRYISRNALPMFGSMLLVLYVLHCLQVITYDADNPHVVHYVIVLAERYLGWLTLSLSLVVIVVIVRARPRELIALPVAEKNQRGAVSDGRALALCVTAILLPLTVAVALGLRPANPQLIARSERAASRVFYGFAFAGEDLPNNPLGIHVNRFLPYRLTVQPLPPQFAPGHYYFFQHPPPEDDGMRIAQEVLAPRLQAEGFALTEGAKGNGIFYMGFGAFDYGGGGGITVWSIQFKRDTCVGTIAYDSDFGIRESLWPVVRRTWDPADYILRVQGRCEL